MTKTNLILNKVGGNCKEGSTHLGHNKGSHVEKSPEVGYQLLHEEDGVVALKNFENLCALRCIC